MPCEKGEAGCGAAAGPPRGFSIAVVVPAIDEAATLPRCLASLEHETPDQIIVVDGGSRDDTVATAAAAGVHVLSVTPARRARQMNAGAAAVGAHAPGADILLFVGADSLLPAGALDTVACLFRTRPELVGGSFSLRLQDDRAPGRRQAERRLRFMTAFSNAYCRRTSTLMCDRGIFVRRDMFERLGGFRDLPVMEDVDLGRRLRAVGATIVLEAPAIVSSARRFTGPGGWSAGARVLAACAAYYCGLPADGLVRRLYRPRGGRT